MPEINFGALKEKAGPLPVWGWIAGIGAAIVAYDYHRNKTKAAVADAAVPASTAADLANGGNDYGPALLTAEYGLTNSLGVLDSNVQSNTGAVNSNTTATTSNTVAVSGQHPTVTPAQNKAHLRAVYDNIMAHLQSATKNYQAHPDAAHMKVVTNYRLQATNALKAYNAAPAK